MNIYRVLTPFLFILLALQGCKREPRPVEYGKDICAFCKMTIMDERFAAQCMSTKGKTYVFDDSRCMVLFLKNGGIWRNEVAGIYFSDYSSGKTWIKSDQALLLRSEELRSPMGGNIAAFSSVGERESMQQKLKGELLEWEDILAD